MAHITLVRNGEGKLEGFADKDQREYARFTKGVKEMEVGELCDFSVWFPRNPRLHRLHFATVKALYEAQEQFEDMDDLRKWLYVGAGFATFVPGPSGRMVAIPESIAFDKLDDADFSELHNKVLAFMRSLHCTAFLWGHLDAHAQSEMIESVLAQFEETA